jgi:hypothetical protein
VIKEVKKVKPILLNKKRKCKRGISELLAYVLLASLAVTLSILVYNWLRFYVIPATPKECPEGVSLIIKEYSCSNGSINITLKNKGLFRVDGYLIKINNETDFLGNPKGLPVHLLDSVILNNTLNPGDETSKEWDYKTDYERVVEVEVEPFRIEEKKTIYCGNAIIKQVIRAVDCL